MELEDLKPQNSDKPGLEAFGLKEPESEMDIALKSIEALYFWRFFSMVAFAIIFVGGITWLGLLTKASNEHGFHIYHSLPYKDGDLNWRINVIEEKISNLPPPYVEIPPCLYYEELSNSPTNFTTTFAREEDCQTIPTGGFEPGIDICVIKVGREKYKYAEEGACRYVI